MNKQEYELDLVDLGKTILKRWKLLVLVTVVVSAVLMVPALMNDSEARYDSSALLSFQTNERAVSISNTTENGTLLDSDVRIKLDTASGNLSDQISVIYKMEPACAAVLTGDEVLQAVWKDHSSEISLAELKDGISVSAVVNTNLLKISVQAKSPEIARDVCSELSSYALNKLPDLLRADSAEVVSTAQLPSSAVPKGMTRKAVVAVMVGLILSVVYVILGYILMPKVHTESMVKNQLGLKLLGTVPAGKEKKSNG